jgi:Fe-S-cluster-containing hydrogenase component 2
MKAISLKDGIIVHDESKCIGCGRCSIVCHEKAVLVSLDNTTSAVDEIMGRIKSIVNVEEI